MIGLLEDPTIQTLLWTFGFFFGVLIAIREDCERAPAPVSLEEGE